jgi:phosphoesterase RecJ-like protein
MKKEYKELLEYIKNSKNILITGHKNPDYDAMGSTLGLYNIINQNFNKKVLVNFEDPMDERFNILKSFDRIQNRNHEEIIQEEDIDLLIVLDANNWKRLTKKEHEELGEFIKSRKNLKTICIDHHPKRGFDNFDLYIQEDFGSAAEVVYEIFIKDFKYKLDKDIAYCIMTGIVGDTGRFLYAKDLQKTFAIASELITFDEQMIEKITYTFGRNQMTTLKFLQELINNTVIRDNYTFSFFTDETAQKVRANPELFGLYKNASEMYVNEYVRTIENNDWGFVITPILEEENHYKVSFRAINGSVDTSVFSRTFPGGGGHQGASGCDFEATDIKKAIEIIETTIKDQLEEATL